MNRLGSLLDPSRPAAHMSAAPADVPKLPKLPKLADSKECFSNSSKQGLRRCAQQRQLSSFLQLHEFQEVNRPRSCGWTLFGESKICAIHVAAQNGNYQLVRILLASGADPESKTSKGRKALDFARAANRDGSHEPVLCLLTGQVKIGTARELRSESAESF
ncbi:unnamed protein product [Effrenium voratum]|nr:unnamed protein product [Effrenium voratum]